MKSFAFMADEVEPSFYYSLKSELDGLKYYFKRFAGANADEATQRTLLHAITHFDSSKGDLPAYLKKLAREITKDNGRLVLVDFLENTLTDDVEDTNRTPTVDTGRISDFSDDVIDKIDLECEDFQDIIFLALGFLEKFVLMCESIIARDTSVAYYPEVFKQESLKLSKKYRGFNDICVRFYREHGSRIKEFLGYEECTDGVWREADYSQIRTSLSRRVLLLNKKTGSVVNDADLEDFVLSTPISSNNIKRYLIKVRYVDLFDKLADYLFEDNSNVLKFVLCDHYVIRTLGGSWSCIDADLYELCNLIRAEILTNILYETAGRVLNIGSECFYLLCTEKYGFDLKPRVKNGIKINLIAEDITDYIEVR